jgi:hypothetical protein
MEGTVCLVWEKDCYGPNTVTVEEEEDDDEEEEEGKNSLSRVECLYVRK